MNILIVEDDFRIADMYKEYLLEHISAGNIVSARSAAECLEILEKESINLILVDIYLPDMLGDDLMEKVIKRQPYMNFIVITASHEGDKFRRMMELGTIYYLVKPVKLDKLAEVVNGFLERYKELAEATEVNQEKIDTYFGNSKSKADEFLPKGIDPVTLKVIEEAFKADREWTSSSLGTHLGTSRTTVRRYLEYMRKTGKLQVRQDYGDKGRPEKIYELNRL
ncbi:response regulator [Salinicoccus roseus]|uniref:Transcriptional regulatory protein n=1 Tax=Salinicoccus roseus TaxID=45670 RepID=A0A0C2E5E9_9STAP|nr:response regulator [Salinicoccus roseus]KIH70572.1 hypothetical protein SN16_07620 [Salinicoccus roseus]MDB0580666.1 response regulator [Salinicoccus roseus]